MKSYDAENRLVSVTGPNVTASFVYDGDGRQVKSTVNGVVTTFVGAHYQIVNGTVTKYYFAGATRIAMRKYTIPSSMAVEYFLSDHLGSTSLTTDSAGAKISEIKYTPWGELRPTLVTVTPPADISPAYALTKYTYTGQYSYMDDPTTSGVTEGFGLMFYQSRFYDPALGRFSSPDSIIPSTQGVQGWDRYAYVNNNPIRYNDPTGHMCREDGYGCDGSSLQKTKIDGENGPRMVDGNSRKESKDYAKRWRKEQEKEIVDYMGGATPAGIPGFAGDGPNNSWPELFSEGVEYASMYSPNAPATLELYLSYLLQGDGNISELTLGILNGGDSSVTLALITLTEEPLPSLNSCSFTPTCGFAPQSPVNIDPGQAQSITICQNCLANNSTTFSHSFGNNKNDLIHVTAVLTMLIDWGRDTRITDMPFMYTIPRR